MMAKHVKYYNGHLIEFDILKLVDFYDPILRRPTKPFEFNDEKSKDRASYIGFSLAETLDKLQGLGLSANQVGLDVRACALNMGNQIWTLFNPEIIERSTETFTDFAEGCLSYPGLYLKIPRHRKIKVRFQAIGGQFVEQEFEGLTAVCLQHELEHLDGIVYTDKVSPIKLEMAKRKVKTNIKKMNKYSEQVAAQRIAESKQQLPDQPSNELKSPSIKILDTSVLNEKQQKEPEKFVYTV